MGVNERGQVQARTHGSVDPLSVVVHSRHPYRNTSRNGRQVSIDVLATFTRLQGGRKSVNQQVYETVRTAEYVHARKPLFVHIWNGMDWPCEQIAEYVRAHNPLFVPMRNTCAHGIRYLSTCSTGTGDDSPFVHMWEKYMYTNSGIRARTQSTICPHVEPGMGKGCPCMHSAVCMRNRYGYGLAMHTNSGFHARTHSAVDRDGRRKQT
jgi:hypothetical protein